MPVKNQCAGCGKMAGTKSTVESVFHNHHSAHKVEKHIMAVIKFEHVNREEDAPLCYKCQHRVLSGMYNGGNWA